MLSSASAVPTAAVRAAAAIMLPAMRDLRDVLNLNSCWLGLRQGLRPVAAGRRPAA